MKLQIREKMVDGHEVPKRVGKDKIPSGYKGFPWRGKITSLSDA